MVDDIFEIGEGTVEVLKDRVAFKGGNPTRGFKHQCGLHDEYRPEMGRKGLGQVFFVIFGGPGIAIFMQFPDEVLVPFG